MISTHPSDGALAEMAAGRLAAGPGLVLATHVAGCGRCRARLRAFESIGGELLAGIAPHTMAPDALARTMALIDAGERTEEPAAPAHPELPAPLNRCEIGPWRSVHPSLMWRRVSLPEDPAANVVMLKVAAGAAVPHHGHTGREFTQVISGGFSDASGRYLPGDCIEADVDMRHQPLADRDGPCVVLASVEGRLRLSSWLGRIVQPLIGL